MHIKRNSTIGIVSVASKVNRTEIESGIELLASRGFKTVVADHVWDSYNNFAATDEQRASDLQMMLDRQDIDAVICSRGGYGSLRTLQHIDWSSFIRNPKPIVGFSDITVLHSKLHNLGFQSIHGAMPKHYQLNGRPTESYLSVECALLGAPVEYNFESATQLNRSGEAEGVLVGGNLSVLYSLRGTPYDIDTRGKILFIEDLNEYLYHLDRMMMNLKVGGVLEGLAGLVVGYFSDMKDGSTPFGKTAEEIIADAVAEYGYPVAYGFKAGHEELNLALRLGETAVLSVNDKRATLSEKGEFV